MSADLRVAPSELETPDDAEPACRVIEPAWNAGDLYDGREALAADLAPLSPGQRALLVLHWCVSEVSNGGFDRFFTNPSGLPSTTELSPRAAAYVRGHREELVY